MKLDIAYCPRCNSLHAPGEHKARSAPVKINEASMAECIAEVTGKRPSNVSKKPSEPKKLKSDQRVNAARTAHKPAGSLVRPAAATGPVPSSKSLPDPKKMSRQELEALVAKVLAEKAHKRKLKAKHQATWRSRQKKEQ